MPFVADPEWLDRVPFKKGPGTVHDRVLRIAYEVTPPDELRDEPLSAYSRCGPDFADGSLESLDFMLRLEREFGPFDPGYGFWDWLERVSTKGSSPSLRREMVEFRHNVDSAAESSPYPTIGHFILFFEARELG